MHPAKAIEIHGHRGARAIYPENTLEGFRYAVEEAKVDVLELDVVVTKDNALVLSHDLRVNPDICQNKDGSPIESSPLFRSLTLEEVKKLDCGSKPISDRQRAVPGAQIPELREVLQLVIEELGNEKIRFNIETKNRPAYPEESLPPKEFAQRLIQELQKFNALSRTILQSFDHRVLIEAKKIIESLENSDGFELAALYATNHPADIVKTTKEAGAQIISPRFDWISKEAVKEAQKAGLKVVPYTLNSKDQWEKALEFGFDGIITDDPAALRKFLEERNQ